MYSYNFIVTYGKTNTFSLTINADSVKEAIERVKGDLCPGATFKIVV